MKNSSNLIILVLGIALFFIFTSPMYRESKTVSATVSEYRGVLDNVSRITERRDALLVNYGAIPREQIARLEKVLPDNVDAVRLALDLDTLAGRYGIAIKDLQVDTAPDQNQALPVLPGSPKGYQSAKVTFSFVSNYQNFARLLADLEKSLRIMDVKSVTFKTTDTGLYEHHVTIGTYWLQ